MSLGVGGLQVHAVELAERRTSDFGENSLLNRVHAQVRVHMRGDGPEGLGESRLAPSDVVKPDSFRAGEATQVMENGIPTLEAGDRRGAAPEFEHQGI